MSPLCTWLIVNNSMSLLETNKNNLPREIHMIENGLAKRILSYQLLLLFLLQKKREKVTSILYITTKSDSKTKTKTNSYPHKSKSNRILDMQSPSLQKKIVFRATSFHSSLNDFSKKKKKKKKNDNTSHKISIC